MSKKESRYSRRDRPEIAKNRQAQAAPVVLRQIAAPAASFLISKDQGLDTQDTGRSFERRQLIGNQQSDRARRPR